MECVYCFESRFKVSTSYYHDILNIFPEEVIDFAEEYLNNDEYLLEAVQEDFPYVKNIEFKIFKEHHENIVICEVTVDDKDVKNNNFVENFENYLEAQYSDGCGESLEQQVAYEEVNPYYDDEDFDSEEEPKIEYHFHLWDDNFSGFKCYKAY